LLVEGWKRANGTLGVRRENIVLRTSLDPGLVSVIPNALVTDQFLPDPSMAPDPKECGKSGWVRALIEE
jgi:hypothetical protein